MRYCYWKRSQDKLLLSTNGVVMRKLSEWNPFVVRIEFFLCFFSSTNRTNVRYAFNSIEELQQLHRKYFDNELCHSKWDYAQSFGRAKIKRKIENTPIRALEVYNAIRSGIDVCWIGWRTSVKRKTLCEFEEQRSWSFEEDIAVWNCHTSWSHMWTKLRTRSTLWSDVLPRRN